MITFNQLFLQESGIFRITNDNYHLHPNFSPDITKLHMFKYKGI